MEAARNAMTTLLRQQRAQIAILASQLGVTLAVTSLDDQLESKSPAATPAVIASSSASSSSSSSISAPVDPASVAVATDVPIVVAHWANPSPSPLPSAVAVAISTDPPGGIVAHGPIGGPLLTDGFCDDTCNKSHPRYTNHLTLVHVWPID